MPEQYDAVQSMHNSKLIIVRQLCDNKPFVTFSAKNRFPVHFRHDATDATVLRRHVHRRNTVASDELRIRRAAATVLRRHVHRRNTGAAAHRDGIGASRRTAATVLPLANTQLQWYWRVLIRCCGDSTTAAARQNAPIPSYQCIKDLFCLFSSLKRKQTKKILSTPIQCSQ